MNVRPDPMVLITAGVTGIVTSVTMIGPLLVDISRDLGISLGQAGLLAAAAGVPQALFSPFSGLLSDRLGRKPMIVVAFLSVAALSVGAALAPSFAALAVVRFLAGLLGSLAPTSLMASVGDLFPAERRARAMGWFNMGFSFAAIGGVPVMGAIGGAFGWRWAFAAIGLVMLLLAGGGLALVPAHRADGLRHERDGHLPGGLGRPAPPEPARREPHRALALRDGGDLPPRLRHAELSPDRARGGARAGAGRDRGHRRQRARGPARRPLQQAGDLRDLPDRQRGPRPRPLRWGLSFAPVVALAILLTLCNSGSRPAFLAYASELAPRQRGALLGLIALTNQSGLVIGSAVGAAAIGSGGYRGMALAALAQGVLAAGLALPLLRRPRGAAA